MAETPTASQNLYVLVTTLVLLSRESDRSFAALALKRSDKDGEGPGLWTINGGKVSRKDWGRQVKTGSHVIWEGVLKRAAVREAEEESGILIDPSSLHTYEDGDVIFIRQNGTPTLVMTFWGLLPNRPVVQLGREQTDYAWVREENLGKYTFIGDVAEHIKGAMRECAKLYP
ncbi:MAG: NUDIX domain-containing protein [Parcubacteria group bacterium]|nr:NUDIX domain-containing protein [Parcubacteria group bacterium]